MPIDTFFSHEASSSEMLIQKWDDEIAHLLTIKQDLLAKQAIVEQSLQDLLSTPSKIRSIDEIKEHQRLVRIRNKELADIATLMKRVEGNLSTCRTEKEKLVTPQTGVQNTL